MSRSNFVRDLPWMRLRDKLVSKYKYSFLQSACGLPDILLVKHDTCVCKYFNEAGMKLLTN